MADPHLELYYDKMLGEEAYEGSILEDGEEIARFRDYSFATMLEHVRDELSSRPEYRLLFRRKGTPYPIALPREIEKLIREDVAQAIAALSPAPVKVIVRERPRSKEPRARALFSGHDTLCDAFGEKVYARAKRDHEGNLLVESIETGRWVRACNDGDHYLVEGYRFELVEGGRLWAVFDTQRLLDEGLSRYYLPRMWNVDMQGWVSYDYLKTLYETYKKEKASVSAK